MQKFIHRATMLFSMILIAAVPLSCSRLQPEIPTATPVSIPSLKEVTPTPVTAPIPDEPTATNVPPVLVPDSPTEAATPSSPGQQEIELRFTDPGTQEECVAHFPFEILGEGDQGSISGGGVIDCAFEIQQCGEGVCVTYHSTYYMDGDLSGFIREATQSYPDGALEAGLAGTFTMKQYWTDIPPETVMAYTEANPFEVSTSDIISLFFHYTDGATQEIGNTGAPDAHPWVFTLHLE